MNEITLLRVIHVIAVVLWIGGVAFVTTVLLPAVRGWSIPAERVAFFEEIESKFATQARLSTLAVGLSGFYIVYRWDLWARFSTPNFWWMHAMLAIWGLFTVMLFVAEPLFLHRWFIEKATKAPEATFRKIEIMHRVLLTASLVTVAGAVGGSHGW